eukprot:scaffold107162_cov24-Attheya_sp.AAC.1
MEGFFPSRRLLIISHGRHRIEVAYLLPAACLLFLVDGIALTMGVGSSKQGSSGSTYVYPDDRRTSSSSASPSASSPTVTGIRLVFQKAKDGILQLSNQLKADVTETRVDSIDAKVAEVESDIQSHDLDIDDLAAFDDESTCNPEASPLGESSIQSPWPNSFEPTEDSEDDEDEQNSSSDNDAPTKKLQSEYEQFVKAIDNYVYVNADNNSVTVEDIFRFLEEAFDCQLEECAKQLVQSHFMDLISGKVKPCVAAPSDVAEPEELREDVDDHGNDDGLFDDDVRLYDIPVPLTEVTNT